PPEAPPPTSSYRTATPGGRTATQRSASFSAFRPIGQPDAPLTRCPRGGIEGLEHVGAAGNELGVARPCGPRRRCLGGGRRRVRERDHGQTRSRAACSIAATMFT